MTQEDAEGVAECLCSCLKWPLTLSLTNPEQPIASARRRGIPKRYGRGYQHIEVEESQERPDKFRETEQPRGLYIWEISLSVEGEAILSRPNWGEVNST
jgi:hypothetical protein